MKIEARRHKFRGDVAHVLRSKTTRNSRRFLLLLGPTFEAQILGQQPLSARISRQQTCTIFEADFHFFSTDFEAPSTQFSRHNSGHKFQGDDL